MARNTYRKQVTQDFGWFTTLPLPNKNAAIAYGKQLKQQYKQVQIVPAMSGWSVRYREPREGKQRV
ncbi:hypothetical protein LSG31_00615 [Fodinisporobacter ferrooxydans]|uniref:Uncharacterized protein n=1 Tax=Fodinisporobacter ferrooxydans TaxID=2901836 RepID=A0ABY4CJX4_9BACL|nr:hypothetical protein LSG31_00615 [Alicyclobacillaceae bacterium MYW30-H2]